MIISGALAFVYFVIVSRVQQAFFSFLPRLYGYMAESESEVGGQKQGAPLTVAVLHVVESRKTTAIRRQFLPRFGFPFA